MHENNNFVYHKNTNPKQLSTKKSPSFPFENFFMEKFF